MRLPIICFLLLSGGLIFASSQEQNSESTLILEVLSSLDSISSHPESQPDFVTVYFNTPIDKSHNDEIYKMVKTFYSSEKNQINQEDVLGFLTNAYSEHDFYESGSWVKKEANQHLYVPYSGELPEYTLNDFFLPVNGQLSSSYGYRPKRHRDHYGVDIAVNMGDTVKCALPGVVTKIGYEKAGYGHYIVVTHSGDLETIYAHLKSTIAFPGQKIKAGEVVGLAGSTGNSTGPHLHFETRYRGMPVNPFSWFNVDALLR